MQLLIKDLSVLTTIPENSLKQLFEKAEWCISDSLLESTLKGEEFLSLDIGIGKLYIKVEDDTIKYRFKPSASLTKQIKQTLKNKKSSLESTLDATVVSRILNTYKDLF